MKILWPRFTVFAVATALSAPGAIFGFGWLWQRAFPASRVLAAVGLSSPLGLALLAANVFAWIAYLVTSAAWIVDRRVSRAWPIAGTLAASSFTLQLVHWNKLYGPDLGPALAVGGGLLLIGLLMVLPATLLSIRLVVFHLTRPSPPSPASPRSP